MSEVKKLKSLPLVSVLMLSYNHEDYIENAIDSIFMQLDDYKDIELLVIDDGSSDTTIEILKSKKEKSPIPFKLILNQHEGVRAIAKNFNKLISLANGKYVSFLASDDEYCKNRFMNQIKIMENNPNVKIVYANGIDKIKGKDLGKVNDDILVEKICSLNKKDILEFITTNTSPFYLQSCLIDRNFLVSFEPFDEDLIADDWVFNIRAFNELIKNNFSFVYLNEVVFFRNLHKTNTSFNDYVHYERIRQVIDKYTPENKRKEFNNRILRQYIIKSIKHLKINKTLYFIYKYISYIIKGKK